MQLPLAHLAVVGGLFCLSVPALAGEGKKMSTQQAKTIETTVTIKVKLNYLLYLPEGYAKDDAKWPLIIFLHGAGETGTNLELVKRHGPPKIVEDKKDFPFIVVSPQSPQLGWDVIGLNALLDDVLAKYRVDADRVYLTGLSMGGYGTWAWAASNSERFAAIVPICGGGFRSYARKLKHMPIWVFHGAKDTAVPLSESEQLVNALKNVGNQAKFTVYPEAGHDSWTESYNNPELYTWLLQQKRKATKLEGSWRSREPAQEGELFCLTVERPDNVWTATLLGLRGVEPAFEVEMEGRAEGGTVFFSGSSADGVMQWTGTLRDELLIGEYTTTTGASGQGCLRRAHL